MTEDKGFEELDILESDGAIEQSDIEELIVEELDAETNEELSEGYTDGELPSDKVADLVEYIICGLVDDVSEVSLDVTDDEGSTLIEVNCSEADTGKVIGRKGRTIKAIRTLARALGQRVGTSVDVEVLG